MYAVFCGCLFIKNWRVPDHSNIERFRSRLSPETQCYLANIIAKQACLKGFAKASDIDIDSTVQKPDIQPPATVNLLVKVASIARRIQKYLHDKNPESLIPTIDMQKIKGLAKTHYFEKRKSFKEKIELKKQALTHLWQEVSQVVQPVLRVAGLYQEPFHLESMPKHLRHTFLQFMDKAPRYLSQLKHQRMPKSILFIVMPSLVLIKTNTIKVLSLVDNFKLDVLAEISYIPCPIMI